MFWSHLHPALIHFVVGLGCVIFAWDLWNLRSGSGRESGIRAFSPVLEGWGALVLLGVGTGWIALAHDTFVQHGGVPLPLGQIHGKMGVFVLLLSSLRILGSAAPSTPRLRPIWIGIDLAALFLLVGTALLGERLVFHQGLGLDRILLQSFLRALSISA